MVGDSDGLRGQKSKENRKGIPDLCGIMRYPCNGLSQAECTMSVLIILRATRVTRITEESNILLKVISMEGK